MMKINLGWIREFVPLDRPPQRVAEDLTMGGLEVEGIETVGMETVLTVSVMPNRPDCLSHLGLARELAALHYLPLSFPPLGPEEGKDAASSIASITIADPEGCPRYSARVMTGVKVGLSPAWAVRRLESVGVRSINNVVDATNYVMMEMGQPLHAFDLDLLAEDRIVVRRSQGGETFRTLDGQDRSLTAGDLLICDDRGPVALAGIMGGMNSEVSGKTTRLLLESACFDPMTIRRTAKRLVLSTEASFRFERGTDPEGTVRAVDRLARLIREWAGGTVALGVLDIHPRPEKSHRVKVSVTRLNGLLGTGLAAKEVVDLLSRLALPASAGRGAVTVTVPSWRRDIVWEEDLVEEVARLHGYQNIPTTMPAGRTLPVKNTRGEKVEQAVRIALEGLGFFEAVNFGFIGREDLSRLRLSPAQGPLVLENPLSEDLAVMRPSLIPGLMRSLVFNLNRRVRRVRLYEVGKVFFPPVDGLGPAVEKRRLAGILAGERIPKPWYRGREESGFFDAKGAVEGILDALGVEGWVLREEEGACLDPGQSAAVFAGSRHLGWLGTLHPEAAGSFGIREWTGCFELDMEVLEELAFAPQMMRPLPRYPELLRDLSLLVPREHPWESVKRAVEGRGGNLASISLFDLYQGKGIPEEKRSLAFSLVFQDPERTLTDEEIDAEMEGIVRMLEETFGAVRR